MKYDGCTCRLRPTAGPPRPDPCSSVGDASAPAATTTTGASTIDLALTVGGLDDGPHAGRTVPSACSTSRTSQSAQQAAPESLASCRKVFIVDCLQPTRQPALHSPQ